MDSKWIPYIQSPEKDDWRGIEDATARKRVQNRLAQRAHRKKFGRKPARTKGSIDSQHETERKTIEPTRDSSLAPEQRSEGVAQRKYFAQEDNQATDFDLSDTNGFDSSLFQDNDLTDDLGLFSSPIENSIPLNSIQVRSPARTQNNGLFSSVYPATLAYPSPKADTHFILLHTTSTIKALLTNASLLSISCSPPPSGHTPSIYLSMLSFTPPSLAPLPLQTSVPHYPYLDLIPIPALRERLLLAHSVVDGNEIWNDLSQEVKVWGNNPWEEGAWEIGERFAVKWWFLMGDEVLRGTNMWRGMRGERRLGVESIKARFASGPALLGTGGTEASIIV